MSNSEPPEASNRRKVFSLRLAIHLGTALAFVFLGLAAAAWFFPHLADPLLVAGGAIGVFVLVKSIGWSDEDPAQEASRARVREAEHVLESALRGDRVLANTGTGTVVITGATSPEARRGPALDEAQARLTLSELWTVTHRRLDHYHGIALGQARQSFRNAQIAMGLGFALLIAFVIVAFNASTTAGTVVAGGLGAVSAGLAGYVSRTFIRSQEAAAGHLRAYFDQPLEFSRYLAAERLMADAGLSEEKRAEVLSLLVQTMIAGPAGAAPTGTGEEQSGRAS
ncbi:hypothetical protein ABZ408_28565 [Streptomyces tibetensis]|uniref:TRADD-N-associated membrane domain-containing protein n=1 Tax=Streptomyces tibetensis TaxID=2382123 RepID=UPI003409DBDE